MEDWLFGDWRTLSVGTVTVTVIGNESELPPEVGAGFETGGVVFPPGVTVPPGGVPPPHDKPVIVLKPDADEQPAGRVTVPGLEAHATEGLIIELPLAEPQPMG